MLVEKAVYQVGSRPIINRPNVVQTRRLRYVGITSVKGERKSMWLPEWENLGQQVITLGLGEIASIEEVDA